jgi:hypothetical protein
MERVPPGEDGGEDATGRRAWGEGAIERKFNGQDIAERNFGGQSEVKKEN